jgi:hypothetical protein
MSSAQKICDMCSAIDFRYLLQTPQQDALSGKIEPPDHPKFLLKYSPGCVVGDIAPIQLPKIHVGIVLRNLPPSCQMDFEICPWKRGLFNDVDLP